MDKIVRYVMIAVVVVVSGCRHDTDYVSLGIDDKYAIERMKKLVLHPYYEGDYYEWQINDSVVSRERDLIFCQPDTGTFDLKLLIQNGGETFSHRLSVIVWEEQVAYSPYIDRVYEFCPAPGQFVNLLPVYDSLDNQSVMLQKATDALSGAEGGLISLGGFGGFVTFGFDHSVCNRRGEADFRIWGNAFVSSTSSGRLGGSCEPGVVMVSVDRNENGFPDDDWYELAGSAYNHPSTIHHYAITYYRPSPSHIPTPLAQKSVITDTSYILWRDNLGNSGYIDNLTYHQQPYFPQWVTADSLTFSGTLLPPNAVDESGNGANYVLYAYDWGYADNAPNDSLNRNSFNIDWAVNADGQPVYLPCIDFVRVYTGIHQKCGWLGETSTEISKAADLHIKEQ